MSSIASGDRTIRIHQREPPGPGPFPAILLLHGAGGNVSFWLERIAPHLTRLGIALYAVHYFDRTGTLRADPATIRDGHHFPLWLDTIDDTLAYIAARPVIDPARIVLFGISLGAFLALAAATRTSAIRAIVEISGGLPPPYADAAASAVPPTLIIHGDADTTVPVDHANDLDTTLTRLAIPHQKLILHKEGHWFSAEAQLSILANIAQFLTRHL